MMNMRFFEYKHLPKNLQAMSKHFYDVATMLDSVLVVSEEKNMALRKLLEAKDCAVRASL